MQKEKQEADQKEEMKYYDAVPAEILENMTPEVRQQYFLWDEMLKRQIQLYPWMLLPLIKEIFGKEYPDGTDIKMLSTEYVVSKIYEYGEKRIESVRSDLLIQVGRKDMYHMECQMKQGGDIAVRMLEYDMNIALVHGMEWTADVPEGKRDKYRLNFPKSAILYLDSTKKTPDAESCTMVFPDGMEYEYCIPILKVQGYTPEKAEEKGLHLLFPFFPIRFRRRFEAIQREKEAPAKYERACKKMEVLKKDLTKFISDCIIIINREEGNGTLDMKAGADLIEFMGKTCDHLFSKEPELLGEVHEIMNPVLKLVREELEEELEKKEEEIGKKEEELKLVRKELGQHIENYIHQCKEEGKSKSQTEQMLQQIFSLKLEDAKDKLEKFW